MSAKRKLFAEMTAKKELASKASVSEKDSGNTNKIETENTSISTTKNDSVNEDVTINEKEAISKINIYRKMASKIENKKTFNDIYDQQNVYIERKLIKAVDKIIRKKGMKKKDIYNRALQMYFGIMHNEEIKLEGDEKWEKSEKQ